jgi:hypothetical protein
MDANKQAGKLISLWPLKVDDVLGDVMNIKPEPKAKKRTAKRRHTAKSIPPKRKVP